MSGGMDGGDNKRRGSETVKQGVSGKGRGGGSIGVRKPSHLLYIQGGTAVWPAPCVSFFVVQESHQPIASFHAGVFSSKRFPLPGSGGLSRLCQKPDRALNNDNNWQ